MIFDLYAELASLQACPTTAALHGGLVSGFIDGCTAWFATGEMEPDSQAGTRKKNEARKCYQERAAAGTLQLPSELRLDPDLGAPLVRYWLAMEIKFKLQSPWYSKDDRPFHVLDNPVRKDRVFGVPYMSAASWKGLLRWACRMQVGLHEHLQRHGGKMNDWSDPDWIIHLFGNEKGEKEDFLRGALAFYPTWFDKVRFEVINPHSRTTRAGTQPILYEVVPPRYRRRAAPALCTPPRRRWFWICQPHRCAPKAARCSRTTSHSLRFFRQAYRRLGYRRSDRGPSQWR